jgi:Protein of unknown function (DUF1236)
MRPTWLTTATLFAILAVPLAAHAQGTVRGAEDGANAGGRAGGPVGAIVGGAVGAATGTVGGILGVEDRPRFRDYAARERRNPYRYNEDVRIGVVLPQAGVTYYDVPAEYHVAPSYRYAYVNDRTVLVDRGTGRIVEVID